MLWINVDETVEVWAKVMKLDSVLGFEFLVMFTLLPILTFHGHAIQRAQENLHQLLLPVAKKPLHGNACPD